MVICIAADYIKVKNHQLQSICANINLIHLIFFFEDQSAIFVRFLCVVTRYRPGKMFYEFTIRICISQFKNDMFV